jgi:hypothetical protein
VCVLIALLLASGAPTEVVPRTLDAAAEAPLERQGPDWSPRYQLEAAVVTITRAASSGVATDLFPEVGLRSGVSFRPWSAWIGELELGVDGLLALGQDTRGTRSVRVAKTFVSAGVRGRVGFPVSGDRFGLTPFAFAEAGLGPGLSSAKVLAQVRLTPILGHWARAGVGLRLRLWSLLLSLDVAVGQHTLRPAFSSWAALGWVL